MDQIITFSVFALLALQCVCTPLTEGQDTCLDAEYNSLPESTENP